MTQLPVLKVEVEGRIVESNFNEFKQQAQIFIKGINTQLATDEDFAQAKQDIKTCKEVEKELSTLANDILKKSKGINDIVSGIEAIENQIKTVRLSVNKAVDNREKIIKDNICQAAAEELNDFVAVNNRMLDPFSIRYTFGKDTFKEAAKNTKSKAGFEKAVFRERDKYKQVITQDVRIINENKNWFDTHAYEFEFLFDNLPAVINKPLEDFQAYVTGRINNYKLSQQQQTPQPAHNPADPLNAGTVYAPETIPVHEGFQEVATEPQVAQNPETVPSQIDNSKNALLRRWMDAKHDLKQAQGIAEALENEVVAQFSNQGLGVFESYIAEYDIDVTVENTPSAEIDYNAFFKVILPAFNNAGMDGSAIGKIVLVSDAYMRLPQELRSLVDQHLKNAQLKSNIQIRRKHQSNERIV